MGQGYDERGSEIRVGVFIGVLISRLVDLQISRLADFRLADANL